MSKVSPTIEQQEAIAAEHESYTVRASAGSGKTTVLVQRYLRLVTERGLSPDEILTITFTRKAAAEMKLRIVKELQNAGRDEDAQVAETGPIQTIHSLCEKILRENALAAGLDPSFEVMDEAAVSGLIEESVRKCISSELSNYPSAQRLVADLAGKQVYNATHTVHVKLWTAIRTVLAQMRGSGLGTEDLRNMYASPSDVSHHWMEAVLAALPQEVTQAVGELTTENGAKSLVAELRSRRLKAPEWLKPSFPLYSEKSADQTFGLIQLSLLAWDMAETVMKDRQQLDFVMLESRAVKLVTESRTTAERLGRQFKAMLVDEAQDVNPVQYRLLAALQTGADMMVGDPQQSIYGFRLADRELFVERTTTMPNLKLSRNHRSAPGVLQFVDDFFGRLWPGDYQAMSDTQVVTTDDDPFGETPAADYSGVEAWPMEAKDSRAVALGIQTLIKEGDSARNIAVLTRQNWSSHEIADRLTELGIATRVIGSAERFYTRLEVRDMANALESVAYPYADFQLLALLRSPFVGLSLDSVALLSQTKTDEKQTVIEALRTFEPPIEQDSAKIEEFLAWFDPICATADRVPAWEVLSALFHNTPYLQRIAERPKADQTMANVRKLFSLATKEPLLNARQYSERIREIQDLRHREGDALSIDEDADAVTLMTIHRAKGLEFEVVVLPDMHGAFGRRPSDLIVEARLGLVMTKYEKKDSVCWKFLHSLLYDKEREEQLRVLYVGMTRAKRRLCVVTSPNPNEKTPAGLVTSRMGLNDSSLPGLIVRRPFGEND